MELLTEAQIAAELAAIPAWTRDGSAITTVTERADFRDALLYVGAVAYLAESANHHPDVAIAWNKVTLTLSTHSAGGLTANGLRPGPPDLSAVLTSHARRVAAFGNQPVFAAGAETFACQVIINSAAVLAHSA